jgi:hypothetical protein
MLPDNVKQKSFWERPEGTIGMIFSVLFGGGALWLLYKALPFIITLLENAIYTAILGVIVFALFWILTDKRFWTLFGYGYKSVMRFVTNLFIQIDPIGILKGYVDGLRQKLTQIDEQLGALSGKIRSLKNLIEKNMNEATDAIKMAGRAKQENKHAITVLKSRKAGRLSESNVKLQEVLAKMEILYRVLIKMREAAMFYIEDIQDQVDVAIRQHEAVKSAYKAMRLAQRIIHGDQDAELFRQTMEYIVEDYGIKVGEIEHFIGMSSNFIDSVDLQNGVYEEEAMKILEDWERKGESLILGNSKTALIEQSYDPNDILDLSKVEPVKVETRSSNYGKLFNG